MFSTVFPVTDATEALIPPPFVPVLSKLAKSPTLYPWPASCISNDLTEPLLTDSIVELCNNISFGSLIKSLSDPTSPTATLNPVAGVTNYEYEAKINEDKRNITILRPSYKNMFLLDMRNIMTYDKSSQYINGNLVRTENTRNTDPN